MDTKGHESHTMNAGKPLLEAAFKRAEKHEHGLLRACSKRAGGGRFDTAGFDHELLYGVEKERDWRATGQ